MWVVAGESSLAVVQCNLRGLVPTWKSSAKRVRVGTELATSITSVHLVHPVQEDCHFMCWSFCVECQQALQRPKTRIPFQFVRATLVENLSMYVKTFMD